MTPFLEKHRDKWIPEPNSGCYLWLGWCTGSNGLRPAVKMGGKNRYAARIVCEEIYGPLPDDHETRHKCLTGMCVNDSHITHGTHQQNMLDEPPSIRKFRSAVGNLGQLAKWGRV